MKFVNRWAAVLALATCLLSAATRLDAATALTNQTVGVILIDSRPCLFFQLVGVSQADPVAPGQAWYAIPIPTINTENYQTFASILMTSKATGKLLFVQTDGTTSCGYATASQIGLD